MLQMLKKVETAYDSRKKLDFYLFSFEVFANFHYYERLGTGTSCTRAMSIW